MFSKFEANLCNFLLLIFTISMLSACSNSEDADKIKAIIDINTLNVTSLDVSSTTDEDVIETGTTEQFIVEGIIDNDDANENPYNFFMQEVSSIESISNFTLLMRAGGGMAALPFALAIIWSAIYHASSESVGNPLRTSLLYSMLLFAVGGVFGYMIEGSNTLVTAHYHGSNGAITMAYMGLIYLLLPRLDFSEPKRKLANWQAHAFGTGQLFHAIGLAWAGGYGMQRKVAGSGQSLDNIQQTAGMALMGIGGLIAVIGGILFLVVVISAMRHAGSTAERQNT